MAFDLGQDLATPFGAALLGAAIGGACTWLSVGRQIQANAQAVEDAKRAEIEGFKRAIRAELETAVGLYDARMGVEIRRLADGEVLTVEWPVRSSYFTIYEANANLVGRVDDAALRRSIILTYTSAKGMLDSLALNTEMVREVRRLEEILADRESHDLSARRAMLVGQLADYGATLRLADVILMAQWADLHARLPTD